MDMPQSRDHFTTQVISRAFEGIMIPSKIGTLLVQKTAALNWGIEHALAGWDTGKPVFPKPFASKD
jgi:hypothetical protein